MNKLSLSIVLSVLVLITNGQNVLQIEGKNVSLEEFKNIFYKNNNNVDITKEYLNEYMELFVNFKLKVREAEELGLDTNLSFINELEGYRKQLAKPYLKNNEFDSQMLDEAYSRMLIDLSASHILFSLNENDSKEDKDNVYNKALEIRQSIINGEISFSDAAVKNSDDNSALTNKGNLGYFTAFMMVYDFESAAYGLNSGEISMPVLTKYGYHLIKINDKREALGKVKVAHIMFNTGVGASKEKLNEASDKINRANELLANGEPFELVAEKFSEDRSTAVKGGILPTFGVGKMVPKFEEVAFSLKNVGDISVPFATEFGYHIIKLLEKQPISEFDIIKADLKRMIAKDSRSELSQKSLIKKLRSSYKVRNNVNAFASFRKNAALKVANSEFKINNVNNSSLFTIENNIITVNEFAKYIVKNQSKVSDIDDLYVNFVDASLLSYEESNLETKYPQYKALLKEYREGILLFDLTNKNVWQKAVEDTSGLLSYFEDNQATYFFNNRLDASIYSCENKTIAKEVRKYIYKKKRSSLSNKQILEKINSNAALSLKIESGIFEKGDNEYIDTIDWRVGISSDIILEDGSLVIVDINKLLPARNKNIDEIRGKVISDYQNHLEKAWLTILKSKYSVVINLETLYSLIPN